MEMRQFRKEIEQRLTRDGWSIVYDHKEATLRIEDLEIKKGVTDCLFLSRFSLCQNKSRV